MIGQFVQFFTQAIPLKPLHGVTVEKTISRFNGESWFSFDFQQSIQHYIGDNFGFRPFFIRLNNQLFYSVFQESTNEAVVVGKENYLFETKYIDSYLGDDFYGYESIYSNFIKLQVVNNFLKKWNTELLIAVAPNKANFFSEYLPAYFKPQNKISNYEYFMNKFHESNYNIIDINAWFKRIKGKKEFPLVSKQGTHYSHYGASLFADSLLKQIEYSIDRKMHHFEIDGFDFSKPEDDTDHDLENYLNIFTSSDQNAYASPSSFNIIPNEDNYKPKMIVIGDSFFWLIYQEYLMSCFKEVNFWYYFKTVFSWELGMMLPTDEFDVVHAAVNTDVIVILTSVTNMEELGFGFIDQMYDFLILNKKQKRKHLLPLYIQSIKRDEKHFEFVKEKAISRQIPVDSMVYLDAGWILDQELEKLFPE